MLADVSGRLDHILMFIYDNFLHLCCLPVEIKFAALVQRGVNCPLNTVYL